jgi:hypothetical protein
MDELFGNLIYFIPIAIVIFRVISGARGQSKKNQPQKKPSGEPVRKIQEPREKAYEKAGAGNISPAPEAGPVRTRVPVWPDTKKKPGAKNPPPAIKPPPVQPQQGAYKSLFPEVFPENADSGASAAGQFTPAAGPLPEQAAAGTVPGQAAEAKAPGVLPGSWAGLTPLQQAFVWSEFLGAPKSEQGV